MESALNQGSASCTQASFFSTLAMAMCLTNGAGLPSASCAHSGPAIAHQRPQTSSSSGDHLSVHILVPHTHHHGLGDGTVCDLGPSQS